MLELLLLSDEAKVTSTNLACSFGQVEFSLLLNPDLVFQETGLFEHKI